MAWGPSAASQGLTPLYVRFMKKTLLLLTLIAAVGIVNAGQPPAPQDGPTHVEFKYYGFYCVIDYTHMVAFTNESGQYMDPVSGQIIYAIDNYSLNGITAVAGWQWRKESALGIGFSYLNDAQGSFSQIPVFLEFRSHFLRNRITPFTSVQLGYSIPFGSKNAVEDYTRINEGGITFGLDLGARFAVSKKLGFNLYVGYQMIQNRSVERGFNQVAVSQFPELYHHYKFGIGINF